MSPARAPDTSDSRRGFAAALLTVVLVFAQLLWPFLHAHQGPPLTSGWHLHTGTQAQGSAQGHPEPALAASPMITPQARQHPPGPESDEVGPGAGLPGGRGLAACTDAALAPPPALPATPHPLVAMHAPASGKPDLPGSRRHHAAGLPPPPHAPPRTLA